MADARRVLDWDTQFACAIDPETAKADHGTAESLMTSTATRAVCAASSVLSDQMNKALSGRIHRYTVITKKLKI